MTSLDTYISVCLDLVRRRHITHSRWQAASRAANTVRATAWAAGLFAVSMAFADLKGVTWTRNSLLHLIAILVLALAVLSASNRRSTLAHARSPVVFFNLESFNSS